MFSLSKNVALLLWVSLFWIKCHGQTTTIDAITSTGTAAPSPNGITDNKDINVMSTDTVPTSANSQITSNTPTSNTGSFNSVETTNASVTTESTPMIVSGLTTSSSTSVSEVDGTISYSTNKITSENNSTTSFTINTTASPNVFSVATTQGVTPENISTNDTIVTTPVMVTKYDNASHASSTESTVNATTYTETNPTGNSTNIPESTESTPTSNSTATSESTIETTGYTQSTEHVATTNSSGSGASGSEKDSASTAGVVIGAVIGSILGVTLICITVYIIFGSKKTSSFTHRRLYEDTRNDPVLRLENPVSPYDLSYGGSSFYNPTAVEEAPYHRGPREAIAMDDIRPR